MTDEVVGRVADIWRHPVKSMRGERLAATPIVGTGLPRDRAYGVVEVASGKVLSAKRIGRLLEASANVAGGALVVELPDGTRVEGSGRDADAALSAWLGREVRVEAASTSPARAYDFGAGYDGPARVRPAFVDSAPVHLVTTASLRAGGREAGAPDAWDARRFRPNVLIDTGGEGFVEDAWVGNTVLVGDVALAVSKATERCVMTTRPQADLAEDRDVLRTLHAANGSDLGVYATVVAEGVIEVGNPVRIRPGIR